MADPGEAVVEEAVVDEAVVEEAAEEAAAAVVETMSDAHPADPAEAGAE
jgi:hypothetical protein